MTQPDRLLNLAASSRFISLIKGYQAGINTAYNAVLVSREIFKEENDIQSAQWDNIINSISLISKSVQAFCEILDKPANIPVVVIPLRYPLLLSLHYADELTSELILLIRAFRVNCRCWSRKMIYQRKEIQNKLELVVQSSEDILQNVQMLLDQMHFEEKIYNRQI